MRYTGPKVRILRRLNLEKLPGLTTKSVRVGSRNFLKNSIRVKTLSSYFIKHLVFLF